jgi:putative peptidoglycan lipid II flippase
MDNKCLLIPYSDKSDSLDRSYSAVPILTISIILTSLAGLLSQIAIAKFFGTSAALDAFFVALMFLLFFHESIYIGGAVKSAFMPVFSSISAQSIDKASSFASVAISMGTTILIIISITIFVFAPKIVFLVAPGFNPDSKSIAILILRLFCPLFPLIGVLAFLTALLHLSFRFTIPAIGLIIINIIILISTIVFHNTIGVKSIALGWIFGLFVQLLLLCKEVSKTNTIRLRISFDWRNKAFLKFARYMGLIMLEYPMGFLMLVIERHIASRLGPGSISQLDYARKLAWLSLRFIVSPLHTAFFPNLVRSISKGDLKGAKKNLETMSQIILFLLLPISIFIWMFGKMVVRVLFQRGEFGIESTSNTFLCLRYFTLGLIGTAIWLTFRLAAHAFGDMMLILKVFLGCLMVYIPAAYTLSAIWGIKGLAMAYSIAMTSLALLLFLSLQNKLGGISRQSLFKKSWRLLVSATMTMLLMFFLNYLTRDYESTKLFWDVIEIVLIFLFGLAFYLGALHLLKDSSLLLALDTYGGQLKKAIKKS